MQPSDHSETSTRSVLISGQGEQSEISLRVALTRRGVDVLPPTTGDLAEDVGSILPDLLLLVGDQSSGDGASALRELAAHPLASLVPVACLHDDPSGSTDLSAFRAGLVGFVQRSDDPEEMARDIATVVHSLSERTGRFQCLGDRDTFMQECVPRLSPRSGVLTAKGAGGSSWMVLGAGEDAQNAVERLESFAMDHEIGAGTSFEFQEWTGRRMLRTVVSSASKTWDERAFRGLRVLVFDSNSDRAAAIAAEMKKHYALVAVRPPEAGLGMDRDLDPEVIIMDTEGLDRGALDVLDVVHRESRLRWVQVVVADWSQVEAFDDLGFAHVAAAVVEGLEYQKEMVRRGELVEEFDFPVQALGPHRTIRTLSNLEGVWSASFPVGSRVAELNLTEGLLVGARVAEKSGPQERPEGLEAVRLALAASSGRVKVRPITDAHIANIMSPVDETFDEALNSAPREPAIGLPADPPPLLGAEAPTIPKTTLLGVAPPEVPGLDEPFTGPGSDIPPPPSSPLPPLPEAIASMDPFGASEPSSDGAGIAPILESAPPDIELISEPPDAMPPAPPPTIRTDDTVKTQAISLDEDGEIEDMPTLAIPQISLDDDVADSDDDGMEALAAAARDAAEATASDEEHLDRYSAYPTMRAPSLADAAEEAEEESRTEPERLLDEEDHPTQAMERVASGGPSEDDSAQADQNADGVFPTVRLSQLDLDEPGELMPPLSAPEVSESMAAPAPTAAPEEEALAVPSFVAQPEPESGGSAKWIWPVLVVAALAVVWVITLEHDGDQSESTAASAPAPSSTVDPAPVTPQAPPSQPAVQDSVEATGAVAAPSDDASVEPEAEDADTTPEPVTPDAEVPAAPTPDAEVAAATPDAALPEPEPAPAEPTPAAPAPVATGSSLPTPDALPECPSNIRRTSRWSRTLSGRALDALDAGDLTAARTALDESICADRRNPHAVIGFARLALAQGQAALAVTWADEACRLRRRRAEYQVIRGDALLANGDQTEARNAWRAALSIEPRNRDARERLQGNP